MRTRAQDRPAFLHKVAKQRAGSPLVLLLACFVVPLYLSVTLPLALVALVHRCLPFFRHRARPGARHQLDNEATAAITAAQAVFPPRASRPVDIVVLGATGLAGGLLAEFLLTEHPGKVVALGGRSLQKLEAVRVRLGAPASTQLIAADANDLGSLFNMCRHAKVVATTVGPFKRFGNLLYHACAHSGTAYCDITGEADWVSHMSKLYDPVAQRTGASLLSFCGVDSVPSELGAMEVCRQFQAAHPDGGSVQRVETVVTRFKGGMPAGTLETVVGVMDGTDQLQRAPPGSPSTSTRSKKASTSIVGLMRGPHASSTFRQVGIPFFMAPTNASAVRTANSLVGFARDVSYTERWGFPDLSAALSTFLGILLVLPWIGLPLLRGISRGLGFLPKASAGHAAYGEKEMLAGSISFLVAASGSDATGQAVTSALRLSGLGDAGGAFTAICQGTIAALLSDQDNSGILTGAGLTPAAALGAALPAALIQTGLVFIEPLGKDDALLR